MFHLFPTAVYYDPQTQVKGKRGPTQPVAQQTRRSQRHPSVCGLRLVLLMAQGDTSRLPVAFALLRRTDAPADEPAKAWFRPLRQAVRRPAWCQGGVVTADAAYAAGAHWALSHTLGDGSVMALPRPWQFATGKALTALVRHRPRWQGTQVRTPTVTTPQRRTFWVYATGARRRHGGDVTVVRRTRRRHDGPNQPTLLVPHRPAAVTAREGVGV
jgi:hypothetical protein